jgi:hypothetical protein
MLSRSLSGLRVGVGIAHRVPRIEAALLNLLGNQKSIGTRTVSRRYCDVTPASSNRCASVSRPSYTFIIHAFFVAVEKTITLYLQICISTVRLKGE